MTEYLIPGLLERERSILSTLAERRRAFDIAPEESLPREIQSVGDCLNALAANCVPVRESSIPQLSQMRLEFRLRQALLEQFEVAALEDPSDSKSERKRQSLSANA